MVVVKVLSIYKSDAINKKVILSLKKLILFNGERRGDRAVLTTYYLTDIIANGKAPYNHHGESVCFSNQQINIVFEFLQERL